MGIPKRFLSATSLLKVQEILHKFVYNILSNEKESLCIAKIDECNEKVMLIIDRYDHRKI